jgi:hypothetical protein
MKEQADIRFLRFAVRMLRATPRRHARAALQYLWSWLGSLPPEVSR